MAAAGGAPPVDEAGYLSQLKGLQDDQRAFSLAAAKLKIHHDTMMDIIRKIA